jgi:hypothetical protein
VALDGRRARAVVGITQGPLTVAHDEEAPDTVIVRPYSQFSQVSGRHVLEERVHVLHGVEPVVPSCDDGEVEVVEATGLEGAV